MSESPVIKTEFKGLNLVHRGKVRDLYEVDDKLLMVATDRISAFDVVMDDPIPNKGKVLTELSLFWFDFLGDILPNHLITADVGKYPSACQPYLEELRHRSMLVKKAKPLPIECIHSGRHIKRKPLSAAFHCRRGWLSQINSINLCLPLQRKLNRESMTKIFPLQRWKKLLVKMRLQKLLKCV